MSKKKKIGISDYDIVNAVLERYPLDSSGYKATDVDAQMLTPEYNKYLSNIPNMAQENSMASGVFYDENNKPRSTSDLDNAGFNWNIFGNKGVENTDKLLRMSTDVLDSDGVLLSEKAKREALSKGVSEQDADTYGKTIAREEAVRRSELGETIAGALGILGQGARVAAASEVVSDKLVPFFHPETQQWVLKKANAKEQAARGSALSAYGAPVDNEGIFNSFATGLQNSLGSTSSLILNAGEATMDQSEALMNYITTGSYDSEDKGISDRLADMNREGVRTASVPQSKESSDIFTPEGFASGLGQGVGSLAQFGGLGGGAGALFRSIGQASTFGKAGANLLNNMSKAGTFTGGMILNGGEAYSSAKEAGLNEEDASTMFFAVGAINSLVEMGLGANKLQSWLVGDKGVKQVPRIILEETGGDLSKLNSVKTSILSKIVDKVNKFTEIPVLGTAVEEASEEFIQTLVGSTGEFLYNHMNPSKGSEGNGLYESKSMSEVFKDAFGAAAIGAVLGGAGSIGSINKKRDAESIMPHIVSGQTEMVKSSVLELVENEALTPETAESYMQRIDRLDQLWNKNKKVFSLISKNEEVNEEAVKAHALSLIDEEFSLNEEISAMGKKMAEETSDPDMSSSVKEEITKQYINEIQNLEARKKDINNKINSFIPDADGKIEYIESSKRSKKLRDKSLSIVNKNINDYNKDKKDSEKIEPITHDNISDFNDFIKFNKEDLDFLNSVNKNSPIEDLDKYYNIFEREASIQLTPDKIKEIQSEFKNREKEAAAAKKEAEKQAKIDSRNKTKKKADKIEAKKVESEPVKEKITPEEIVETLEPEQTSTGNELKDLKIKYNNLVDEYENASTELQDILVPDLLKLIDDIKLLEENENNKTPSPVSGQELVSQEEAAIEPADDQILDPSVESNDKLTPAEEAVLTSVNQDEASKENESLNSDGLVVNDINSDNKIDKYRVIDTTFKRAVGNTLISLNVDYTESTLGNVKNKVVYYDIEDSFNKDGKLKINANFDSRLQSPNDFTEGDEVSVVLPTYNQIVGSDKKSKYTLEQYNKDLTNPETYPIGLADSNGIIVGYLPTTDNVRKRVKKENVELESIFNKRLRESILENKDSKMTLSILSKTTGTPLFQKNNQSVYKSLGDGSKLANDTHVAIYKEGKLQVGLNNVFPGKIKLPEGVTSSDYFDEGVSYSIIPTAQKNIYYAFPMEVSRIGANGSNTIVKMLELYKASDKFNDTELLQERQSLSYETDFSNFKELSEAISNIMYVNNDNDKYMFKLDNKSLILGPTKDMQFTWNSFRSDPKVKDIVKDILSRRYYAVKLANMNEPLTSFSVNSNNKLEINTDNDYLDFIDRNNVLTSNVQSEPIKGTSNDRYFTAQSVIELGNVKIEPKQLEQSKKSTVVQQSNITVKEGVSEVFNENSELASIGTQEQYSQYLNTIFPDSKVKDIVYHGSNKKFDNFIIPNKYGTFFTASSGIAKREAIRKFKTDKNLVKYSVVLNIQNPKIGQVEGFDASPTTYLEGYDSMIMNRNIDNEVLVVLKSDQIHILGSKQDIEGFKNYVNSSVSETTSTTEEDVVTTQPAEATTKPKNKLGVKLKGNRNKPRLDEDFSEIIDNTLTLEEQAKLFIKKCQ